MTPQTHAHPISIRRAVEGDWPAIAVLLSQSGLPVDGAIDHLAGFRVACSDAGEVVGVAGLEIHGAVGLLRSVTVSIDSRGAGISAALIAAIVADAREKKLRSLHLLTTTAPQYFARLGFVEDVRDRLPAELHGSAELQGACPATAVAMTLTLERV